MRIDELSEHERSLLLASFRAAADGPFFPEWEFKTLMGFSRGDLRTLIAEWPSPRDPALLDLAGNNVLNMLLAYPHREWDRWAEYSAVHPRELRPLLARWRGESEFDRSARGTFDRLR